MEHYGVPYMEARVGFQTSDGCESQQMARSMLAKGQHKSSLHLAAHLHQKPHFMSMAWKSTSDQPSTYNSTGAATLAADRLSQGTKSTSWLFHCFQT